MSAEALRALELVLDEEGDADDALRAAVRILAAEPGIAWAGIAFLEDGELVLGPASGTADEPRRVRAPVSFQGETVGEVWADGEIEPGFLEAVAELVSAHVLIGWDTGGERWDP